MNMHLKPTVISIDAATVNRWINQDEIVLVDVRETAEFDQEHIPGALLQPMSVFDAELFPTVPGKKIVLHCAIGKRSLAAGKMLINEGHSNVMHLEGGLIAWKEAGFETDQQFIPPAVEQAAPAPNGADPEKSGHGTFSGHPGEVLVDEFMQPLDLGKVELAAAIGVDVARINGVVSGETAIDAELSLRLARYFCTDNDFWLNLQLKSDLAAATLAIGKSVETAIKPRLCD